MPPGVLECLQLVVPDIETARAELVERGTAASPVQHVDSGFRLVLLGGPPQAPVSTETRGQPLPQSALNSP